MRQAFGIRIVPCRFRQDCRGFSFDRANRTVSDALTSIRHISQRVADVLYDWKDRFYLCFTDLLYDMEMHPAFDSQVVEILIRLDYFREFGSPGKLLRLYREFREGEFRFSKSHIPATQEKRLAILRRLESEMPDSELPLYERLRFETAMCGSPFTTDASLKNEYTVLEVDERYSPRLRLYSIASGRTGTMKLKKAAFREQPLHSGDIFRLLAWERKPSYRYVDGKAKPDPERRDLWITAYE